MPKITPGNRLYFYQLLGNELGVGKQTPIARVGEVLAEADVLLEDVECESIEQLVEELSDFLKVTVFKKGRVFVTVMASEELDALLEKAEQVVADKVEPGAKSWRRARRTKDVRPVKPRHKRKPVAATPAEEAATTPAAEETQAEAPQATTPEADVPEVKPTEPAVVEPATLEAETPTPEPAVVEAPTSKEAEPVVVAEGSDQPEPAAAVEEPSAADTPESQPEAQDGGTVTESPADEPVPVVEETATEAAGQDAAPEEAKPEAPRKAPEPRNPKRIRTTPKLRRIAIPTSISTDVFCPSELLAQLHLLLPPTVGIMEALDESWSFAQEAGTAEGTRSRLTFPLSRTGRPGYPIEVTIARAARIPSGKAWQLVDVDAGESDDDDSQAED